MLLNNKLNGCSLEQVGEDFYIVGADAVRKKLGSGNFTATLTLTYSVRYNINATFNGVHNASCNITVTCKDGNITCSYSGGSCGYGQITAGVTGVSVTSYTE